MELFTLGRWRPVQGAVNAFCVFVGARGLIDGPVAGGALDSMSGGIYVLVMIFYASLLVGGATAMVGEIIQLRQPLVTRSPEGVGRTYTGILVEMAGNILMSANLVAFTFAIIYSPILPDSRSYPYVFLGLGIFGRTCQCYLDLRRIRGEFACVLHKS